MGTRARVSAPRGSSGNVVRDSALGLVPQTLDAYLALNRAIWERGPLPPAEVEVARLRNAQRVGCVFCKAVRYDLARADGLTEERVGMIDEAFAHSGLSEREKLIIAFTDQYHADPGGMPGQLRAQLERVFSGEELAHLSLAVAHFSGFSRCAVALGGMPDEVPVMEISLPD
ncbi:MAG: alkylhydroperoxidase [Halioglobus sp.]|nr:alkylhydroperoxidase [Halioglobus sp.]